MIQIFFENLDNHLNDIFLMTELTSKTSSSAEISKGSESHILVSHRF